MKTRKPIRAVFALLLAAVLICGTLPAASGLRNTGRVVTFPNGAGTFYLVDYLFEGDFEICYVNREGTRLTATETDSTYGVSIRRVEERFLLDTAGYVYIPDTIRGYPVVRLEKADSRNHYMGVHIPATVTEIVDPKFSNCPYLEWIEVDENNPNYYSVDGVLYKGNRKTETTHLVCYPQSKKDESFTTYPGAQYINDGAFNGNAYLKTLTIAIGQRGMSVGAIRDCNALETLIFGEGELGLYGLSVRGCPNLRTVHISDSFLLGWPDDPTPDFMPASAVNGCPTFCCAHGSSILSSIANAYDYAYCVCGSAHTYAQQNDPQTDQPTPDDPTPDEPDDPETPQDEIFWFSPCYEQDAQGNDLLDENGSLIRIGWSVLGLLDRSDATEAVTIPAYHKGLPVLEIGSSFGFSFENLTGVHIPSTVQRIAPNAFAYRPTLTTITVDADSAFFKAVDNVLYTADGKEIVAYPEGKETAVFSIPEGTERVADVTVHWSSNLRQINVPSTFTDGRIAETLDTAKNLEKVCVSAANPALFADEAGVLYNKTQSTLLFCPPCGPTDYTLPQSVTQIADRSLCGKTLQTLRIADGVTATPIVNLSSCVYSYDGSVCLHVPQSVTTIRFSGMGNTIKLCSTTRASQVAAYAAVYKILFLICNEDHSDLRLPTDDDPPAPALQTDDAFTYYYISETDENGVSQFTGVGITGMVQTPDDPFVLAIPAEYSGLPVREFAPDTDWAKTHGEKVTRIALPQTVETVKIASANRLHYFQNLKQVTVHTANPYLRASGGVLFDKAMATLILYPAARTNTSYAIPDGVVTVADSYSFSENPNLQRLTIPASFTGTGSYNPCVNAMRTLRNLQSFSVDPENPVYASDDCGVLYTADRQMLMLYPPAAPADVYTIPASVEDIFSRNSIDQPEHLRVLCISDDAVSTPFGSLATSAPQYVHIPSTVRQIRLTVSKEYQKICSDSVDSPAAAYAGQEGLDFLLCDDSHTHFTPVDPSELPQDRFDFSYITEKDANGVVRYTGVCIKGLRDVPDGPYALSIPETYLGLPVRQIEFNFMSKAERAGIVRIDVPKTVESLEGFPMLVPTDCTSLQHITVDEDNAYYRAVDGVLFSKDMTTLIWYPAAKTDTSYAIPEGVRQVDSSRSFACNPYLRHLTIPASFEDFGTAASTCFSSLRDLQSFAVAAGNPTYSSDENGVLYNADKTTIILYPCANPAEQFTIPASVKRFGFYSPTCYPRYLRTLCVADGVTRTPSLSISLGDSVQVLHIPSSVQTIRFYESSRISSSVTICSDSADSAAAQFARDFGYAFEVCSGHSAGTTPDDPPVDPPAEPIALRVCGGTARPGDLVRVTVDLTKNSGVVAARLHLSYDPSVLTLTGVQDGGLFETASFVAGKDLAAVPYTVLWEDALTHMNHTATGTLVTFTFRVSETAEAGTTPVTLTVDEASTYDVDLQNVACAVTNGAVTVSTRVAGDANGDGMLDLRDVVLLRRFLAGGWNVTLATENMDVDGDGVLSLKDSTLLSRYLAGGWNVTLR